MPTPPTSPDSQVHRTIVSRLGRAAMVLALLGWFCGAWGCGAKVTFNQVYDSVFKSSCAFTSCHGGGAGGLNLQPDKAYDALVNVESTNVPGQKRVVPNDPDNSLLLKVFEGPVGKVEQMPKGGELPQEKRDLVRAWIQQGATKD